MLPYISNILFYLGRFFYSSDDYILYQQTVRKEAVQKSEEITEYSDYRLIPGFIIKKLMLYPLINPLYHRLRSNKAHLICINHENVLIAYGWIQSWAPFKRKFGWFTKEGTMLGPFWTDPEFRGKGYYQRLLNHCKDVPDIKFPLIIFTNPPNVSSQKGIEKAGFEKKGVYRVYLLFRYFQWHKKVG